MKFLLLISFRNLLRQKRRNLLLGAAMAIGMAVLTIAHAFSHGISDVMFNRILTYVSGHVSLAFSIKGNYNQSIFHDGERILGQARKALPNATLVDEAIGVFSRVVGNGISDNVILVGVDPRAAATPEEKAEMEADFGMKEGKFDDVLRKDVENPLLVASEKAAYLKVKVGDVLRARFQDVYGRNQAVRLTVVGIFNPSNIFMTAPVFMDVKRLRAIAGYGPHDIGALHITLPDPKINAIPAAESLHAALHPPLALAHGRISAIAPPGGPDTDGRPPVSATVLGFAVDTAALRGLAAKLNLPAPAYAGMADTGGLDTGTTVAKGAPSPKAVLASRALADSLGLSPGDLCTLTYATRHDTGRNQVAFRVTGIIPATVDIPGKVLLVNDKDFYGFFYGNWPAPPKPGDGAFAPDATHPLHPFLAREWILMQRTATTEEMQKKYRNATRLKTRAVLVDVQTMYESASMIIKLEYALNLITLSAVLILFFIIQVGVVNTLRMTIRERTREIGTMRAIGMQRGSVRGQFLLETFFLSLAASVVGLILAFIAMALLKQIPFEVARNPLGMLLVNGRLHFVPTLLGTASYILLILGIAAVTAWFPARRAANLSPAEALRHFG